MLKKFLLIIVLIVLVFLGREILFGYFDTHSYYIDFLRTRENWLIVVLGYLLALLPMSYVYGSSFSKKIKKRIRVWRALMLVCTWLFFLTTIMIASTYMGGALKLFLHLTFVFLLIGGYIVSLMALGSLLYSKIFQHKPESIFQILLSFGLGLIAFLLFNQLLILAGRMHSVITWLQLIGAGAIVRHQAPQLKSIEQYVFSSIAFRPGNDLYRYLALFLCSLVALYTFFLFFQSYIPYSTARDANHAYMFYPKMRAANSGYYRYESGMTTNPHIRYAYITYWFSLFLPSGGFWGLSEDTIAIIMNSLSGIFVLVFGTGLIAEMLTLRGKEEEKNVSFYAPLYLGILLLLAWLSSGMGAFLIFVDNKTDLGVMALLIIGLYSGFVFIKSVFVLGSELKGDYSEIERTENTKKLGIVSGIFFAVACLAKPTALFDVVSFLGFLRLLAIGMSGSIAIVLAVLGITTAMQFRGIKDYLPTYIGEYLLGFAVFLGVVDLLRSGREKLLYIFRILLYRGGGFLVVFLLFKSLYRLPRYSIENIPFEPGKFVERLFFAQEDKFLISEVNDLLLLADTGEISPSSCSLAALGYDGPEQLYESLQDATGSSYNEDVGRYIGYGWKGKIADQRKNILPYIDPWWGFLFREGCVGLFGNREAGEQCRNTYDSDPGLVPMELQSQTFNVAYNQLGKKEIYIPYKYLVLQNITYNRSLSNPSSYYTDIGYIWLILILLLPLSFLIGLMRRNRILLGLSIMTLGAWTARFFIGGAILRYGIGLIIRTILTFVSLLQELLYFYQEDENKDIVLFYLGGSIIGIVTIFLACQLIPNYLRISSMGNNIISSAYKLNTYENKQLGSNGEIINSRTVFNKESAFNLQFGHYIPFIQSMQDRDDDAGALIAGTYARYFVDDQSNIKYDQFLTRFQKNVSDNDVCKSYLRLRDNKLQYIALDPNIGTVVQGEGNISLFHRFFANVDDENIIADGAVTMFAKMVSEGYATLVSTNNIGAKYALSLPSSAYDVFGENEEERILLRSQLMVPRYFLKTNPEISRILTEIAIQRVENGFFVEDIADVFGMDVDKDLLLKLVSNGIPRESFQELTADEKQVLTRFIDIQKSLVDNKSEGTKKIQEIISKSISSSNQIIVVELKK